MSEVSDLIARWSGRDEKYRSRRNPLGGPALSADEVRSVQWWRTQEAKALSGDDRNLALMAIGRWSPPPARIR